MAKDSIAVPISLEATGFLTVVIFHTFTPNITSDILRAGIMLGIWHTNFALGYTLSAEFVREFDVLHSS